MRMAYGRGYMCTLVPDRTRTVPAPAKGVAELLLCLLLWGYRSLILKGFGGVDEGLEEALACGGGGSFVLF